MPKTAKLDMPPLLTCLYSSTRLQLDLPTLLEEGAKIFEELHLTLEQCMLVEEKTREQRKSRWWFDHRAGRVTASAFYEAASTKNFPSLIKRICYPRSSHFSTEATRWGLQNEDTARESYWKAMQDLHIDFHITASGLMINPDLPWIGASPDGVVTCKCHGMGVLEIKCPFTANGRTLKECARDPRFCLTEIAEGTMTLRRDHSYMFQVQAQMRVAEVMYADFVVWTPQELFTQRILFDESFFDQAYLSVEEFIRTGILPELLGKWFTVPRLSSTATADLAPEGGAIVESQLMQTSSHAWLRLANENTSIGRV
ncbi:uncharacterized protein LOC121684885 isoform X3 [Alosa sapidissima]|uniref:uncharacterized protein LOC121684885 isoform X3 n=1 Tax=Alosa sapidissima TaxID=34773 RepID=UPI001C08D9ED|nr:uncharacterized protein LOC121684885 isoform X3 [Alosa sapidissima]